MNRSLLPIPFVAALACAQGSPTPDPAALAAAYDRLAAAVAPQIAGPDQNLCVSPASLGLCLSMLLPGARGETLAELQRLLGPAGLSPERTIAAIPPLLAPLHGARKLELTVVHDLWPQAGHPLLPGYVAAVRSAFGAEPRPLDFRKDPPAARKTINDAVAKATRGRIVDLLAPDAVDADTRLVLTNAIYLKADWKVPFPAEGTHDATFHRPGGDVAVPTMHLDATLSLADRGGVLVLQLPYVDPDFVFEVALPPAGAQVAAAEQVLQAGAAAGAAPSPRLVAVALPRFRIEGSFELARALRAAGLVKTTTQGDADLSGIDGGLGRLYVEEVVQKTFLDVAEKGTEAAAATAIVAKSAGAPPPTAIPFVVDRPFAYALRHTKTGLTLFAGRCVAPISAAH